MFLLWEQHHYLGALGSANYPVGSLHNEWATISSGILSDYLSTLYSDAWLSIYLEEHSIYLEDIRSFSIKYLSYCCPMLDYRHGRMTCIWHAPPLLLHAYRLIIMGSGVGLLSWRTSCAFMFQRPEKTCSSEELRLVDMRSQQRPDRAALLIDEWFIMSRFGDYEVYIQSHVVGGGTTTGASHQYCGCIY